MKHYTTIYRLSRLEEDRVFDSEKAACEFLGVKPCGVSSYYLKGKECRGWKIERIGLSTHGETNTRIHRIWSSMHERCERKSHEYFRCYGGRGIKICEEWNDYKKFREWALNNGYSENLTLDRIDVNGDYCPENCRWADWEIQQNNKRSNHNLTYGGKTQTISEWSRSTGINKTTIRARIMAGWSVEDVLNKPVRKRLNGHRLYARMDLEDDNNV